MDMFDWFLYFEVFESEKWQNAKGLKQHSGKRLRKTDDNKWQDKWQGKWQDKWQQMTANYCHLLSSDKNINKPMANDSQMTTKWLSNDYLDDSHTTIRCHLLITFHAIQKKLSTNKLGSQFSHQNTFNKISIDKLFDFNLLVSKQWQMTTTTVL